MTEPNSKSAKGQDWICLHQFSLFRVDSNCCTWKKSFWFGNQFRFSTLAKEVEFWMTMQSLRIDRERKREKKCGKSSPAGFRTAACQRVWTKAEHWKANNNIKNRATALKIIKTSDIQVENKHITSHSDELPFLQFRTFSKYFFESTTNISHTHITYERRKRWRLFFICKFSKILKYQERVYECNAQKPIAWDFLLKKNAQNVYFMVVLVINQNMTMVDYGFDNKSKQKFS